MREVISLLIVCSCLSALATAQEGQPCRSSVNISDADHTRDFGETVVPITDVRVTPRLALHITGLKQGLKLEESFGTGFCLDAACRFIVTNYHVAMMTRPDRIQKEAVVQRYFATGPHDQHATVNETPNVGPIPYAVERDLALFELRRPLAGHHGLTFSVDELEPDQEVDIYGYPANGPIIPFRKLTRFSAKFKGPKKSEVLAFEFELSAAQPLRIAGSSGGIVVDRKTEKIVGILRGTNENQTMAEVVPTQTLVKFVTKTQPFLAAKVFPAPEEIPPASPDIYPKFVPPTFDGLQHRSEEPYEVRMLRERAQALADGIGNFIAVQSYAWGRADGEPDDEAQFEVRVVDGHQTFRSFPEGTKELDDVPAPATRHGYVTPGDEWSKLPKMVGTQLKLKVRQAPDVAVNHRAMKVFQYYAPVEDDVCSLQATYDYGLFKRHRTRTLVCSGEVWTDENFNILRISERLEIAEQIKSFGGWKDSYVAVTYDWLERLNEPPRLAPLTIYTEARDKKQIYWCRGHFTDYRVFSVGARIAVN